MKLLVIGAGMYVTGRGTAEPGTVMTALAQAQSLVPLDEVVVCAQNASSADDVAHCARLIEQCIGRRLPVSYRRASEVLSASTLAERFDGCILAVPDHLHHALGMRVISAGLPCLMVKPLVPTLRQLDELVALQERQQLHCAVEFHKRFDEANLIVRRLIREGALGRLSHATVDYSQRIQVPREAFAKWAHETNSFQYLGVHYVDLFYFMTGFQPLRALAVGTRGILSDHGIDTYDSVHALVEWQNPVQPEQRLLTQFATGWIDPDTSSAMSDQRFSVVGSLGRIDCDQKNRGVTVAREGKNTEALNPYFAKILSTMDGNAFSGYGYKSIERFLVDLTDLRERRVTLADLASRRPTFRDARAATAVVEAVNASLRDGSCWKDADATI